MTHRSVPRFRIDHDYARDRDVLSELSLQREWRSFQEVTR